MAWPPPQRVSSVVPEAQGQRWTEEALGGPPERKQGGVLDQWPLGQGLAHRSVGACDKVCGPREAPHKGYSLRGER